MGRLRKAVVLGRGRPGPPYERQALDRLAEALPDDYRIWRNLTLFAPTGEAFEIDAVVLGHHGLYLLELKKQIAKNELQQVLERVANAGQFLTLAMLQHLDTVPPAVESALRLGGTAAALQVAEASSWIETLLVVTGDEKTDVVHVEPRDARLVTQAELPNILLTGKLPGVGETTERAPLEESRRLEIARFFDGLRHRVRPGRGNLLQELRVLQFELMADMRALADVSRVQEAAALWLMALVFVRILEAYGYIDQQRLTGENASAAERGYFEEFPTLGPHDYLRFIVEQVPILAAMPELKRMQPSADGARAIFDFFRREDIVTKRWKVSPDEDRIWPELYTLGEDLAIQYAMFETPRFVAEFLLERTLMPALKTFGRHQVTVMDPACGTGTILVWAFKWLCNEGVSARDALDGIHGVDISPIATTLTRMRLLLAYMESIGARNISTISDVPNHVETANALLWNARDERYAAVVCNPPYVTEKNHELRAQYSNLYRSASGNYSLVAPFIERAFQLASPDGCVGMLVSNSFCKREFGRALVEEVLPQYALTHVIDLSGAYVPGHGTPTMLLLGRNQRAQNASIRVVAGNKGEPISPLVPEKGFVWSSISAHTNEPGYEDEYISVADVPRERLSNHPWMFGSHAVEVLLDRLRREPQTLSAFATRIHSGSQSGLDAIFILPAHVTRRLSFEAAVLRPYLQAPWIRDFGVRAEVVALAPYRSEDETALCPTDDEPWLKYLWKYRTVLQGNAKRWHSKSGPWWKWQRWMQWGDVSSRIVYPSVAWHNHFARLHGRMATAPTIGVIDLPRTFTDDDALALLGWLNSSTACFWFRQVGATLKEDILFLNASLLKSMPIPANFMQPGPIRDKVILLAKELDELARSLEDQYAPARVLDRWDGSSRDRLLELLGEAQMRDQSARRKMVCRQEDLDWVTYEALGWTKEAIVPIASSATPDQRPYAWLSENWPRGLQRPLVEVWQKRRRALRADPLLAVLESQPYKRPFDDTENDQASADEIEDVPVRRRPRKKTIDYWESTAKACELWMLDRIEQVFRESPVSFSSMVELKKKLEGSAAPAIVASVWGSRRSRVTTLADMLGELLLEYSLPALVSERHTASGLEKRAAWKETWALQRRKDAGEDIPEIPELQPFQRDDYRDAVSYRLRGAWDVPTERIWVHQDERSNELRYGWPGWTDEQKTAVYSGMGEI